MKFWSRQLEGDGKSEKKSESEKPPSVSDDLYIYIGRQRSDFRFLSHYQPAVVETFYNIWNGWKSLEATFVFTVTGI